jgi:hypothetical protein
VGPDYLVSAPHVSNPAGIRFIVVSDIPALSKKLIPAPSAGNHRPGRWQIRRVHPTRENVF